MLVDQTKFPSLSRMTDTAHALNLTASWYLNADGCTVNESMVGPTYATDSADAVACGFDGVKFDTQRGGPSPNITRWALALKSAASSGGKPGKPGKPGGIVIENCLDKHPTCLLDDPEDCPFNHYRSGPDNAPDFFGGIWRVWYWTLPFLRVKTPVPASRPHCWASTTTAVSPEHPGVADIPDSVGFTTRTPCTPRRVYLRRISRNQLGVATSD